MQSTRFGNFIGILAILTISSFSINYAHAQFTSDLTESISISDSATTQASFSLSLTDVMSFVDSVIRNLTSPVVEETTVTQTQPAQVQTSKSGGSGRTNVNVDSVGGQQVSLSRISEWSADERYFKFAIRDLISKGYLSENIDYNEKPPGWILNIGKLWDDKQISDQEFYNAINYLMK